MIDTQNAKQQIYINQKQDFQKGVITKLPFLKILFFWFFLILSVPFWAQNRVDSTKINLLNEAIGAFEEMGELDSANFYYHQLLPQYERSQNFEEFNNTLLYLTWNFYSLAQYDSAIHYGNQMLEHAQKYLAKAHENHFWAYQFLGLAQYGKGDIEKAIKYTQTGLDAPNDNYEGNLIQIIENYNNLGIYFLEKGDFNKSIEYLLRAKSLLFDYQLEGEEFGTAAMIFDNLGLAYFYLDNYEEAILYNQKALKIYLSKQTEISPTDLPTCYNNLALSHLGKNHLDSSFWYLEAAQDLIAKNSGRSKIQEEIQFNLGFCYLKGGNYAAAETKLRESIKIYQENSPDQRSSIGKGHFYLAEALNGNYKREQALQEYQVALQILAPAFISEDLAQNPNLTQFIYSRRNLLKTLHSKAVLLADMHQEQAAINTFKTAVELIDQLRTSYQSEASKAFLATEAAPVYENAVQYLFMLWSTSGDEKYLEQAYYFIEKSKAPILLEAVKEEIALAYGGVPIDLIQAEKQMAVDIPFYEKKLWEAEQRNAATKVKLYKDYLFEKREALTKLKENLAQNYPKYFQTKYAFEVNPIASLQDKLDPQTCFIEYFWADEKIYVLQITSEEKYFEVIDLPMDFESTINAFITLLQQPSFDHLEKGTAHQLYAQNALQLFTHLIGDHQNNIPEHIHRLVIVPDGMLFQIPFEVLLTKAPETANSSYLGLAYLLKDYAISYSLSGTVFQELLAQKPKAASHKVLALAPFAATNSNSSIASRSNHFKALPHSEKEVQSIGKWFDTEILESTNAPKFQFISQAPKYKLLHLATHGSANYEQPAFSYLAFPANSSDSLQNNLLHSYEIQNLNLNAQLAVLSACETGIGKIQQGEGSISLARGFFYAGVPSVLMTLWQINDASSQSIMGLFYQHLHQGLTKDKALQQAKLDYLNFEADDQTAHPYYWAGYVALGNSDPIETIGLLSKSWQLLALTMILFSLFFAFQKKIKGS